MVTDHLYMSVIGACIVSVVLHIRRPSEDRSLPSSLFHLFYPLWKLEATYYLDIQRHKDRVPMYHLTSQALQFLSSTITNLIFFCPFSNAQQYKIIHQECQTSRC